MKNLFYLLAWKLFGIPSVVLLDFDGSWHLRRVRFIGTKPFAARFGAISCNVFLEPGGKCRGVSFVNSWEPAIPADPMWHPQWQRGEVVTLRPGETPHPTSDPVGFTDEQVKS